MKGIAFVLERSKAVTRPGGTPEEESRRFKLAFEEVHADLEMSAEDDDIFSAHLEMLDDPMLSGGVEEAIARGATAEDALETVCASICGMFAGIDDEYLRARVDDVKDVCNRMERVLAGTADCNPFAHVPDGAVIVAEELFPSDTALMDFSRINGFITARGSSTSHVCIIARAKGIPALVGFDISGIRSGDMIDMPEVQAAAASFTAAGEGRGYALYCNAGSLQDIRDAMGRGADGIGLFRTEFLFMQSDSMPSEDEQYAVYAEAVRICAGKPLTIRTLDIGGDKDLPYLPLSREDNPFLGLRGVRLTLARPDVLEVQLRAIARASALGPVRVMFPMISTVGELRRCKEMLAGASEGISCHLEAGMMVETPAAALNAASFASECDFFSIGTNDLIQYVMAADRGNSAVSYLYDSSDPAVMAAIVMTVKAAAAAGIRVGVCGEMASDPEQARRLLEVGVDSLSVSIGALQP